MKVKIKNPIQSIKIKHNKMLSSRKDLLFTRLLELDESDLRSIAVSSLKFSAEKVASLNKDQLVMLCSKELRSAAGSTTLNVFRGTHTFPYKKMLIDVADKLTEGSTFLSWTPYKLNDQHTEEEIEAVIVKLFEEKARQWWFKLSDKKKVEFVTGLNGVLSGESIEKVNLNGGFKEYIKQQAVENLFQNGVVGGLTKVAASGVMGTIGVSMLTQIGWVILLQTVGFMGGLKIVMFGIGGMGAFGGAVSWLGATAVSSVLAIPTTVALVDGTAYRKTIPAIIMLLAKSKINHDLLEEQFIEETDYSLTYEQTVSGV
ncbi:MULTISPECIES: hypothetical protein [unclassified Photobacterium]|uniref:hypothetical protein n=1 Tax=unclassified Photobacterium TaxID=2628852 RepID=UPI001EDE53EE|nr:MULTISPECIES: hypothetical protein [unclassified Photobacterium]MCG3864467.1 hypothetical protein [Photobacterium sp. Ph6]MCG3877430.1 hypothetical protein [Photobacterium sp. Ph5]